MADAGKIIAHIGDGLYSVEILRDDTILTEKAEELLDILNDIPLSNQIIDLRTAWLNKRDEAHNKNLERDALIDTMNAFVVGTPSHRESADSVRVASDEALVLHQDELLFKKKYDATVAFLESARVERNEILVRTTVPNPIENIWCADLSDGASGRFIYPDDALVQLWAFAYDPTRKLLPPGNTDFSHIVNGVLNIPHHFPSRDDAAMTFWNAAMEPGFAKWVPLVMLGVLNIEPLDCDNSSRRFSVTFPAAVSRSGLELAFGTLVNPAFTYFDGKGGFKTGDEVAVLVTEVSDSGRINEGEIVGYAHDPRVQEGYGAFEVTVYNPIGGGRHPLSAFMFVQANERLSQVILETTETHELSTFVYRIGQYEEVIASSPGSGGAGVDGSPPWISLHLPWSFLKRTTRWHFKDNPETPNVPPGESNPPLTNNHWEIKPGPIHQQIADIDGLFDLVITESYLDYLPMFTERERTLENLLYVDADNYVLTYIEIRRTSANLLNYNHNIGGERTDTTYIVTLTSIDGVCEESEVYFSGPAVSSYNIVTPYKLGFGSDAIAQSVRYLVWIIYDAP